MTPAILATAGALLLAALPARAEPVERIVLQSSQARLEVTPALGGRALHFSAPGSPNLIRVGDAVVEQPSPMVSAFADDIGHLGHDVWLGPQSGWWTDQEVNPARRAAAAVWPPDPFLAFAGTTVLEHTPERVVLEGIDSPVTGVRLRKTFALDPQDPATVHVEVHARNVRDRPVSRDLWFNTRASAAMRIYVPVAAARDVRVETTEGMASPQWRLEDGLFSFVDTPLPEAHDVRRGKAFLQPSDGWMAGFAHDQVFVIRFTREPEATIHPEHGQVELYLDHGTDRSQGLLELEVHAPYRTLAPGETMQAREAWTVLRYDGVDRPDAHAAFLCAQLALCATAPID